MIKKDDLYFHLTTLQKLELRDKLPEIEKDFNEAIEADKLAEAWKIVFKIVADACGRRDGDNFVHDVDTLQNVKLDEFVFKLLQDQDAFEAFIKELMA